MFVGLANCLLILFDCVLWLVRYSAVVVVLVWGCCVCLVGCGCLVVNSVVV